MTPPISRAFSDRLDQFAQALPGEHPLDALERIDARRDSSVSALGAKIQPPTATGVSQDARRWSAQKNGASSSDGFPGERDEGIGPWHRHRRRHCDRRPDHAAKCRRPVCVSQPPNTQKPPHGHGHDQESHQLPRLRNLSFLARLLYPSRRMAVLFVRDRSLQPMTVSSMPAIIAGMVGDHFRIRAELAF